MKNLFKKAHELTRKMKERYPEVDYQTQFGLCLSYLFEEEKEENEEVKELKGTPKQIAWAEDIREEQLESFYRFRKKWIQKWEKEGNEEELEYIEKLTEKIEAIDEAKTWIEIKQRSVSLQLLLSPKRRDEEKRFLGDLLEK